MKILLSHRYFWPDSPPYAIMLRSIAARLVREGHDVTVFSSMPSYRSDPGTPCLTRETLDGARVIRTPIFTERKGSLALRAANVAWYGAALYRHIVSNGPYDVVTAASFPPIVAGRTALAAARKTGARFVYHCQDLHPEVSLLSGQLTQGRLSRRLQRFDAQTCARADRVIVLSSDMADTLRGRPGGSEISCRIINNFLLEDFGGAAAPGDVPRLPKDKMVFIFAGNIGTFQALDKVIDAAHMLRDLPDVQFWFVGDGAAKNALVAQAGSLVGQTVFFVGQQTASVAQAMMGEADFNLVSLRKGLAKVAYPSKTLVALSRSSPLLAMVEASSELGRMIVDERIGYVAAPEDAAAIAGAVRRAYAERHLAGKMRKNVHRLYSSRFAIDQILDRWAELMAGLARPGSS